MSREEYDDFLKELRREEAEAGEAGLIQLDADKQKAEDDCWNEFYRKSELYEGLENAHDL